MDATAYPRMQAAEAVNATRFRYNATEEDPWLAGAEKVWRPYSEEDSRRIALGVKFQLLHAGEGRRRRCLGLSTFGRS